MRAATVETPIALASAVMRRSLVPIPLVVIPGWFVAPTHVMLIGRSARKHGFSRLATDLSGGR
jgi:hypothetical protein